MPKMIQPSLAGGEVSPATGARIDLEDRYMAVEYAENYIASFTGSMFTRPGQKFVARAKPGSAAYRIIEFEFNTEQTYVLELGDQYMRFHTAGAQILDSTQVKTITGATAADPVVITSTGHTLSNGDEVYIAGVAGMTELNGRSFLIANTTANTFELQTLDGTDVDGSAYTAYSSGGTATPPYEITTPWAAADLFEISYAQSGDVMGLVHEDYQPRDLERVDNDSWTLTAVDFKPAQAEPTNIDAIVKTTLTTFAITSITQANPAVVTTGSSHGFSDNEYVLIENVVGMTEINNFVYRIDVQSATTFALKRLDDSAVNSSGYTAYTSGGTSTKLQRQRNYTVTAVSGDRARAGPDG